MATSSKSKSKKADDSASSRTRSSSRESTRPSDAATRGRPLEGPGWLDPDHHPFEREAEYMADAFGDPDGWQDPVWGAFDAPDGGVFRQARSERESVAVPGNVDQRLDRVRSGGSPLEQGTRERMESHFGTDFDSVRVHSGDNATDLARAVDAVQREARRSPRTDRLKRMLSFLDARGALDLMDELNDDEVEFVLSDSSIKRRAGWGLDNEEMYQAVVTMGGDLHCSLEWMFYEGTSWEYLRNAIAYLRDDETLADLADLRDEFVGDLTNETMVELVELVGGALHEKLRWMDAEGTNFDAIRRLTAAAPPRQRIQLYNHNDIKELLVDEAGNAEMREFVALVGGPRSSQTEWLEAEGVEVEPPTSEEREDRTDDSSVEHRRVDDEVPGSGGYRIDTIPDVSVAVPGATITYQIDPRDTLEAQHSFYTYTWWTVRDGFQQRLGTGARIEHTWSAAGSYRVICVERFHASRGQSHTTLIEYPQTVVSRRQRLDESSRAASSPPGSPRQQTGEREQQPDKAEQKEYFQKLSERLESTKEGEHHSLSAAHLAFDSARVSELRVIAADMGTNVEGNHIWRLVDITNPTEQRLTGEYEGTGPSDAAALLDAIDTWDEENRYPDGTLRLNVPEDVLGRPLQVEFSTDGMSFWDSWASFFDSVGLWTGLAGLGLAGVSAIAPVPGGRVAAALIVSSMITSAAGAGIRIAERRAEGFGGGRQEMLDIVTIAGNLAGLGTMGAAARTARTIHLYRAGAASPRAVQGAKAAQQTLEQLDLAIVVEGVVMAGDTCYKYVQLGEITDPVERRRKRLELLAGAAAEETLSTVDAIGGVRAIQQEVDFGGKLLRGQYGRTDVSTADIGTPRGRSVARLDEMGERVAPRSSSPENDELQRLVADTIGEEVPRYQDESLAPGSAVVVFDTNRWGNVSRIEVWHGPPAESLNLSRFREDLRLHRDVVDALRRYRGLSGIVRNIRQTLDRSGGVTSEKWRVRRELEKLTDMIRVRWAQVAAHPDLAGDPMIREELDQLRRQLMELDEQAASASAGTNTRQIAAVFQGRGELERTSTKKLPPSEDLVSPKKVPGVVTGTDDLIASPRKFLAGKQGNAGFVPREVGEQLEGRVFNDDRAFRNAFWRAVSNTKYAKSFSKSNCTILFRRHVGVERMI